MLPGLTDNVTMILALSAASERLVALIKGFFKSLDERQTDKDAERKRQLILRFVAIVSGIVTAALASSFIIQSSSQSWKFALEVVGLGILAGGGSDLWNSVLGYLNSVKDIKKGQRPAPSGQ